MSHWFKANRPEYVFLVAGTVGGILANSTRPAEFIYDNMMIHGTVVHAAHEYDSKKLLYLGSSCIYPRQATQPITEAQLLTGRLEPTNDAYAVAKSPASRWCSRIGGSTASAASASSRRTSTGRTTTSTSRARTSFRRLRKFHNAKKAERCPTVTLWGTGSPRREFLHADDIADACVALMRTYDGADIVNVGVGEDIAIINLARQSRRSRSASRATSCSTTPSPTAPRGRCWMSRSCVTSAGARRSTSRDGIEWPTYRTVPRSAGSRRRGTGHGDRGSRRRRQLKTTRAQPSGP